MQHGIVFGQVSLLAQQSGLLCQLFVALISSSGKFKIGGRCPHQCDIACNDGIFAQTQFVVLLLQRNHAVAYRFDLLVLLIVQFVGQCNRCLLSPCHILHLGIDFFSSKQLFQALRDADFLGIVQLQSARLNVLHDLQCKLLTRCQFFGLLLFQQHRSGLVLDVVQQFLIVGDLFFLLFNGLLFCIGQCLGGDRSLCLDRLGLAQQSLGFGL